MSCFFDSFHSIDDIISSFKVHELLQTCPSLHLDVQLPVTAQT